MEAQTLKLFAVLKQIRYSGKNIGDDLSFAFETNGEIDFLKPKIRFGQSIPVDIVLWRKPAIEGETVNIHVKTLVTEEDWVFSDAGEGEAFFSYEVSRSNTKNYEFQVNVNAKGEGKKTAIFSFVVEVSIKEADYSRFDEVLEYMYNEMITNIQSQTVTDIKAALEKGNTLLAYFIWWNAVRDHAKWDHKPKLEDKFGLKESDDYYLPIRGDTEHEYFYDIWSNIHYGYVGSAAGFDSDTLHKFAESGGPGAGKTDDGDKLSLQIGIDLWNKYHSNLTKSNVINEILSHTNDYLIIQRNDPSVATVTYWVDGGNLK
jgi:hypothetical protein